MLELLKCPVCKSENHSLVLQAEDYTVSHEKFDIRHCSDCSLRFTSPVPSQDVIGKYYQSETYVSHSNTSKGLVNKIYQVVRKRTMNAKKRWVHQATGRSQGSLLDIGSGAGAFLFTMKNSGWDVLGLEPDTYAREVALRDFGVVASPIEEFYQLSSSSFHAITMWHVLEHVHDLDGYMAKIRDLLTSDGKLFVAVPNYTSLDANHYQAGWAAYDVPRHLYHFSPQSMRTLIGKNGLKLLEIKRMPYDSFYVSMLSEQYRGGNLISALWNGLRSYLKSIRKKDACSSIVYVIGK